MNTEQPMVSVLMITYNHEKFIRQAIEGVLMQKVDFEYELLIHDDASPDRTADIIREYEAKYPKIVKPIYQTENQYSQGIDVSRFNRERARGKYLASCEGDDYWTDPFKLQKQIDFLESHPEYIACAHNVQVIDEVGNKLDPTAHNYPIFREHVFSLKDAEQFKHPGHVASIVYHNVFLKCGDSVNWLYTDCKANGDTKLPLILTYYGDIYCLSDIMADHRKIVGGGTSWSSQAHNKNMAGFVYLSTMRVSKFMNDAFGIILENQELESVLFLLVILRCIVSPTKENRNIVLKVINEKELNSKLLLLLIRKCLSNPIKVIKTYLHLFMMWYSTKSRYTI